VVALRHQLNTARAAIETWNHHVGDMERLRAGTLSPAKATQMWSSMWRRGYAEIQDYRAAARAARATSECGGTAVGAPLDPRANMHGSGGTTSTGTSSADLGSMDMGSMDLGSTR
jgi:hypothetical protein